MPDRTASVANRTVQETVSLSALKQRLVQAGKPAVGLDDLTSADPAIAAVVTQWLADVTRSLTDPLVALAYLLNLDAVVIGGRLPLPLIERLSRLLTDALVSIELPFHPRIIPAAMAADAPAIGAAMLPFLDHVLPSESILMQVGRS